MNDYYDLRYYVWLKSHTKFVGCDSFGKNRRIHEIIRLSLTGIEWWNSYFKTKITDIYIKPHPNIFIHVSTSTT